MLDAFFSPAVTPFAVAIVLMLIIAVVEVAGALMGMPASAALDSMLPDIDVDVDVPDIDFDADGMGGPLDADAPHLPDTPGAGPLSSILGWLCVGKVPILVLLVVWLTAFGLTGFVIQGVLLGTAGFALPSIVAVIPAFMAAMPVTRYAGLGLAKVMPKEQTEATSTKLFIGKVATIVRGEARKGAPAEAKLRDSFGQTHYILVEPDMEDDVFRQSDEAIVVRQSGSVYQAIRNTSAAMSD